MLGTLCEEEGLLDALFAILQVSARRRSEGGAGVMSTLAGRGDARLGEGAARHESPQARCCLLCWGTASMQLRSFLHRARAL